MSCGCVVVAMLLDHLWGEPRRWHPLVGFGRLANALDALFTSSLRNRFTGVLAWSLAVLPMVAVAVWLSHTIQQTSMVLYGAVATLVLYVAVGFQSLKQHARVIAEPLLASDLPHARSAVAMIVSRDTGSMDDSAVATATVESVLENGADAVFAAIFWFLVAGIPGVVLYRLANTLDAMWGYKNARYVAFGWAAARMDDVLNVVPAILTAITYLLATARLRHVAEVAKQGVRWKSVNAGFVMAAGATALDLRLGGSATYGGTQQYRPVLGHAEAPVPKAVDVHRACELLNKTMLIWLLAILLIASVWLMVSSVGR